MQILSIFIQGVFTIIAFLGLVVFNNMNTTIINLGINVAELNTKMAVIIMNSENLTKVQSDHEHRLRNIEQGKQ